MNSLPTTEKLELLSYSEDYVFIVCSRVFCGDLLCTVPDRIATLLTVMKLNSRMVDALPYGPMTSNNGSQCHPSKHREASAPGFDTYVLAKGGVK